MYLNNIDPHIKLFKDLIINRKTSLNEKEKVSNRQLENNIKENLKDERILEIKNQIKSGSYKIDYYKLAKEILGY
ncbi:MAG: flagellar biosynthesis anti-sigma factor FlgM [Elusimicrobiales bacterium]|nr:flagellar biosynthesis anti-sigma factor FlgM [Elusimicrobiales bacterium]